MSITSDWLFLEYVINIVNMMKFQKLKNAVFEVVNTHVDVYSYIVTLCINTKHIHISLFVVIFDWIYDKF